MDIINKIDSKLNENNNEQFDSYMKIIHSKFSELDSESSKKVVNDLKIMADFINKNSKG